MSIKQSFKFVLHCLIFLILSGCAREYQLPFAMVISYSKGDVKVSTAKRNC